MRIVLREDQRLGYSRPSWEEFGEELVLECLEHGADLIVCDNRTIKLLLCVRNRLIDGIPAHLARLSVAKSSELTRFNGGPALGDRGFDAVDGKVNIDTVSNG